MTGPEPDLARSAVIAARLLDGAAAVPRRASDLPPRRDRVELAGGLVAVLVACPPCRPEGDDDRLVVLGRASRAELRARSAARSRRRRRGVCTRLLPSDARWA